MMNRSQRDRLDNWVATKMNRRAREASIRKLEAQREKLYESIKLISDVLERLHLEKAQEESPIKVGDVVETFHGTASRVNRSPARRYLITEIYSRYEGTPAYKGRCFLKSGGLSDKIVDLKWKTPVLVKGKRDGRPAHSRKAVKK